MTELAERLRLFEPLLDELAAEFCLEAIGPMESRGDPVSDYTGLIPDESPGLTCTCPAFPARGLRHPAR